MPLRSTLISALLATAAATVFGMPGTAGAQTADTQVLAQAAQTPTPPAPRRKQSHAIRNGSGTQIACTILGCSPIPRDCHPEGGRTWDGNPTGYDVIVCPYR